MVRTFFFLLEYDVKDFQTLGYSQKVWNWLLKIEILIVTFSDSR